MILLLTLMLFGTAFGQQEYTDKELGYQLTVPAGWTLKSVTGARFAALRGSSRILLITAPVGKGTTAKQFASDNLREVSASGARQAIPLSQLVDMETIDGRQVWVFGHYVPGQKGTYRMTFYATVDQSTGYLFSAADYTEKVKAMQPDVEAFLKSLRFKV